MQNQLITMSALTKLVPYSKVHIYRLIRENKFPKAVKLGGTRIAFVKAEVDAWVSARIEQRDTLLISK